jgi:hypothetical protein
VLQLALAALSAATVSYSSNSSSGATASGTIHCTQAVCYVEAAAVITARVLQQQLSSSRSSVVCEGYLWCAALFIHTCAFCLHSYGVQRAVPTHSAQQRECNYSHCRKHTRKCTDIHHCVLASKHKHLLLLDYLLASFVVACIDWGVQCALCSNLAMHAASQHHQNATQQRNAVAALA